MDVKVFTKQMFSNSYHIEISNVYATVVLSQFFYVDSTTSLGVNQVVAPSVLDVDKHCEGVKAVYDKFNEVYQFVVDNQQVVAFSGEVDAVIGNMIKLINNQFGDK